MQTNEKDNMISRDFFPDGIKINEKRIFPMAVIATMSSGKSTLINALLGKEILPNSNAACTALNYSILDDDQKTKEIICDASFLIFLAALFHFWRIFYIV